MITLKDTVILSFLKLERERFPFWPFSVTTVNCYWSFDKHSMSRFMRVKKKKKQSWNGQELETFRSNQEQSRTLDDLKRLQNSHASFNERIAVLYLQKKIFKSFSWSFVLCTLTWPCRDLFWPFVPYSSWPWSLPFMNRPGTDKNDYE